MQITCNGMDVTGVNRANGVHIDLQQQQQHLMTSSQAVAAAAHQCTMNGIGSGPSSTSPSSSSSAAAAGGGTLIGSPSSPLQQRRHILPQQQAVVASSSLCSGAASEDNDDPTLRTNLIVNYLPQTMSQDDIRALFSSLGDIESCKLIRDKTTGQSLGYGFVNYKHPDSARKAIECLNGLRLQNKTIKVSHARPSSESIKDANLYISGLPSNLTQQELERIFSSCGKIISARIIYDNQTGLSKGVGFVRFDRRDEAERAVQQLNGVLPNDSSLDPITVKFANSPSSCPSGGVAGPFGVRGHGSAAGSLLGRAGLGSATAAASLVAAYLSPSCRSRLVDQSGSNRFRLSSVDGGSPGGAGLLTGCGSGQSNGLHHSGQSSRVGGTSGLSQLAGWCLFVYNLAPETEENVLWQLFGPFGAVQSVKVVRDQTTAKCKGFGFVTMTNYEEALVAIAATNGYQLGGRVLQVSFKKSKNQQSPMGGQMGGACASGGGLTDGSLAAAIARL